jgi:carboxypeptidase Q
MLETAALKGASVPRRLPVVASLLSLCVFAVLSGQAPAPPPASFSEQVLADLARLQAAALESDYAWEQVAHLCDNVGPRLSGSAQYLQAAQYVADQLRRDGFDSRLEKVMVPHWVRGVETAELVAFPGMAPGTTQRLAVTALGGSVATPAPGITAPVVVVRDFDELTVLGREKVAGRIVVFEEKFDRQLAATGYGLDAYGQAVAYRGGAASAAARFGAVASLIRSAGGAEFRLPHTGGLGYDAGVPKIPGGALAAEDADLIARLARQGEVRLHLVLTPREEPDAEAANVVADFKGADHPEEVVIVSGHLDSWDLGTGAIDDAAGVGTAMAAAHLVKQLGLRPARTIRVVAWANEENGVRGGLGYAVAHKGELTNHVAAIEVDLGAGHPVGINYDAAPSVEAMLRPVMKVLGSRGASLLRRAEETGTDLIPVSVSGVPTFAPIQDDRTYFDYHHTAADTLDKIRPEELRENVALAAVLAYALANMNGRPPGVPKPLPEWLKMEIERQIAKS